MKVKVKRISVKDIPSLIEVEIDSFPEPWESEDFYKYLSSSKTTGLIALVDEKVIAYVICRFYKSKLCLVSLAVSPKYRRKKIATNLVKKLISSTSKNLYLTISEKNFETQLFFRFLGFKAIKVVKNFFGLDHDGYDFLFDKKDPYSYEKILELDQTEA
jgi:[ribosomal protein S18]-alanine N-acetyltransferase